MRLMKVWASFKFHFCILDSHRFFFWECLFIFIWCHSWDYESKRILNWYRKATAERFSLFVGTLDEDARGWVISTKQLRWHMNNDQHCWISLHVLFWNETQCIHLWLGEFFFKTLHFLRQVKMRHE